MLGAAPVLGGLCQVGSYLAAPGVIKQVSQFRRIVAGELDGRITPRVEAIVAALNAAGAVAEATSRHPESALDQVHLYRAVQRRRRGEPRARRRDHHLPGDASPAGGSDPGGGGCGDARRAWRSIADVAAKTLAFCDAMVPNQTASMQRDILDGKPSELESIVGIMVRLGAELGVPTPVFRFFYAALLPQEKRLRQRAC